MTARDPRTGDLWIGGTAFFDSIFVARKIPGRAAFEPPVIAHTAGFVDKGWLAAGSPPGDPSSTHPYLAHNNGLQASSDLGTTWSSPPLWPHRRLLFLQRRPRCDVVRTTTDGDRVRYQPGGLAG